MKQTSSRSGRDAAANLNEAPTVGVADESSCSSSLADSQASLSLYKDHSAHVYKHNAAARGSVFQYFDRVTVSSVNCEHVEDSVSLPSSSVHRYSDDSTTSSTQAAEAQQQQAEDMMYSTDQPFNSEELIYLGSIFETDEHSNEGDLSSILSL